MVKYTDFVKESYDKVRSFPAKERMAKIAEMWRASGMSSGMAPKPKGKGKKMMAGGALDLEPKGGALQKNPLLDSTLAPVANEKQRLRPARPRESNLTLVERNVPADMFDYMTAPFGKSVPMGVGSRLQVTPGMGMADKMTTPFGTGGFRIGGVGSLPPKRKAKAVKGGGMLEDLESIVAQAKGGSLRKRKVKGGGMLDLPTPPVNLDLKGAGLISSGLAMLGLGLPMGVKDDGKLGKAKLAKLKAHVKKMKGATYAKHLQGAGFWDDAVSGISQGFNSVVGPAIGIASHFL